jgi:hypothetical protein
MCPSHHFHTIILSNYSRLYSLMMLTETCFQSAISCGQEIAKMSHHLLQIQHAFDLITVLREVLEIMSATEDRGLITYDSIHQYGNLIKGNLSGSGLMVSTV